MKVKSLVLCAALILALTAVPAFSAVLEVGPGKTYSTIQAAVDAASAWDTIIVYPGNYDEDVNIRPNKTGLSILSTEIVERGPTTTVKAFSLLFAPDGGPNYVTIKGFSVGPGGDDNGVGIESSGDYTTIAFNHVHDCNYDGIRINQGNVENNVHHNIVNNNGNYGINAEAQSLGGGGHNIHQNEVYNYLPNMGLYQVNGIFVSASDCNVHQNKIKDSENRNIRVSGDDNKIHQNISCDSNGIQLTSTSEGNKVHHNVYTGSLLDQGDNKVFKNDEVTECPFDGVNGD